MADSITPTQPLAPSLPVIPPPEDKRHDKKKQQHDTEQDQNNDDEPQERPHQGLFDEYV